MANAAGEQSATRIGQFIVDAAAKKGASIKDLSIRAETTYEHMRRIVRGDNVPSKHILRALCTYLDVPYREAEKLAAADRIQKKFGTIPQELSGKKPGLDPVERVWDNLTPEQQQSVIMMVQAMAKQNRISRAAS